MRFHTFHHHEQWGGRRLVYITKVSLNIRSSDEVSSKFILFIMLAICKTLYLSTLKQSCHLQDHHGIDYQDLAVIVSSDHQDALISDLQNSPTAVNVIQQKEVLYNKNKKPEGSHLLSSPHAVEKVVTRRCNSGWI